MNYRLGLVSLFMVMSFLWGGQAMGAPGDPLWEQTFNYQTQYDVTQPVTCAASSSTLIVCGSAIKQTNPPGTSTTQISIGFIRAYDVATGTPKWQGVPLNLASTPDAYNNNSFGTITISGNIAMIQGTAVSFTYNTTGPPWQTIILNKTILRAYNLTTGQLLWENVKDGHCLEMKGGNTYTTSNLVFMIGFDKFFGTDPPANGWVRAYQIPTASAQGLSLLLDYSQ
jgi:hypothetical protein